jgi:MFS family permease
MSLYMRSLGASIAEIGIMNAGFGVGLVVSGPIWGWLSDKVSKKRILILASIIMPLNMFSYTLTREVWMFLPIRFLNGVINAAFGVSTRGLTAAFSNKRVRGYGLWYATWSLSSLVGSPIGGYLAGAKGYIIPFYVSTIVAVTGIFVNVLITEPKKKLESDSSKILNVKTLVASSFLMTFFFFGFSVLSSLVPVYAYESTKFLASETEIGLMFALMAIIGIPARIGLGELSDKIGKKILILLGMVFCCSAFLLFPVISGIRQLYLSVTLFSIGSSAIAPCMLALVVDKVSVSSQGKAIGIFGAGEDLGFLFGPLIGSYVYQQYSPASSFYLCAVLLLSAIVCTPVILRKV